MAPPTKSHPHFNQNSHNQNHAHDTHSSEEKDKRKFAIISSNPDPKKIPQIVKCHMDLGSTSFHAGCIGQHHRHSGIPRGIMNSKKQGGGFGAHGRGDLIPNQQNHDECKKTNNATPSTAPAAPHKKQHQHAPSGVLTKRKPILVNPVPSAIPQPQQVKSMLNNNDQLCTNSVVDYLASPHIGLICDNINSFEHQQSCKSMQCCTIPSEVKVLKESSTVGQQCTKSIICCSEVSKYKLDKPNCGINVLKVYTFNLFNF